MKLIDIFTWAWEQLMIFSGIEGEKARQQQIWNVVKLLIFIFPATSSNPYISISAIVCGLLYIYLSHRLHLEDERKKSE